MVNSALIYTLLFWLFSVGLYQGNKPLPPGINYASDKIIATQQDVQLLSDLTSQDSLKNPVYDHHIFDSLFHYIGQAEQYILLDMFLFNQYTGPSGTVYRDITAELVDILVHQKQKHPNLKIDFITDPVNTFYGGVTSPDLTELAGYGINVIVTDLKRTRDSTPGYSSLWRTFFQWFGNSEQHGILPNPFDPDGQKVTLRSYLIFLNLKANHRKVCIVDTKQGPVSFVMSANPHSASSDFSNIALMIRGEIANSLYETETSVAKISGGNLQGEAYLSHQNAIADSGDYALQILTEEQIKDQLIRNVDILMPGDTLYVGMFYFSNRDIIKSLLRAGERGAVLRLVLDPNKDGFGFYRSGIPNQVSGGELVRKSGGNIKVRWYETHGEEYHAKIALFMPQSAPATLILGSANYTRKNLNNYNLELDVMVTGSAESELMLEARDYFEVIWENTDHIYTVEYEKYENTSIFRTLQYRFQEFSGFGVY